VREIDAHELAERIAGGEKPLLVDVRQPWEHELVHLPGDVLVPLPELPARAGEIRPAPGQLVVCYCHHGVRSLHAVLVLAAAGLADAVSLRGGIDAWSLQIDPRVPRY
jgi:adenylyltransferase/sulfurtransferase